MSQNFESLIWPDIFFDKGSDKMNILKELMDVFEVGPVILDFSKNNCAVMS